MQINLLKLMEETDVNLHSQTDIAGQIQALMEFQRGARPRKRSINTRHILFIVSGAFDKLAEQVKRRVQSSQIGFAAAARDRRRTTPISCGSPKAATSSITAWNPSSSAACRCACPAGR